MNAANQGGAGADNSQGNGAVIVGKYRYLLWRTWNAARPRLLWILLNPSTADGETDDPTLRRCIGFSKDWQYGGLEIVNLFALQTSHTQDLYRAPDSIGNENDRYIAVAASHATGVIVAWGEMGTYRQRDRAVLALLAQYAAQPPYCLGMTRNGCPRHPLYIARGTTPFRYGGAATEW